MRSNLQVAAEPAAREAVQKTVFPIIFAISFAHLLNDMMQSVIPAVYPLIKDEFNLSFTEIGLITLTFQLTASVLQPFVGLYTDKHPFPMSLPVGMTFTFAGLLLFSVSGSFAVLPEGRPRRCGDRNREGKTNHTSSRNTQF
jgi:MFS transporter, FSR family, fosmidomycin resistance protein